MSRDIERYTEDYLKDEFEEVMVRHRRKKVLEILTQYHPRKILEIGCGTNSIFEFYKGFDQAVVVEPSAVLMGMAKKGLPDCENICWISGFLEEETAKLQKFDFDFILCSSLLHEVEEPGALLSSIHQICKPDTVVHLNVPNADSFHLLWAEAAGLIPSRMVQTATAAKMQQHTKFNRKILASMVKKAGFSIRESGSYYLKPFNHKKMAAAMKSGLIDENLDDALDVLIRYFPENGAEIYVNCEK